MVRKGKGCGADSVDTAQRALVPHLVGVVHEVHRDAEGQGVVVRIPQQDGDDLHP